MDYRAPKAEAKQEATSQMSALEAPRVHLWSLESVRHLVGAFLHRVSPLSRFALCVLLVLLEALRCIVELFLVSFPSGTRTCLHAVASETQCPFYNMWVCETPCPQNDEE